MDVFLLCCSVILLAVICLSDIRTRIIANNIVLLLCGVIFPYAYLSNGEIFFLHAIVTLIVGIPLFGLRVVGAGDVKLLAVLMLAIPSQWVIPFLFLISFFGLILILFGWVFFRQSIKTQGLPYGVAISSGYLATLWLAA